MQNLYNDLEILLKDKPEFVVSGKLNKSRISDAAYQYNETLLKILLSNASLKKQFFMEVGGATVFKQRDFLNFLKNKDFLPNSFTEFKNQIGLQDESGEYYRENKDVVLVFPFKDCVLEGGQDKEDQKRNEIFYNATLAPDEITRLKDPKALTNFKLYDSKGEQTLTTKTEIDFSKQNLIMKGNNLLALHSLTEIKSIAGQVKLIYIDPPYNTGGDSFKYNDRFNHSTWLTFMKNRLEVAKQLLKVDGVILVQCDHHEMGYLNLLLDEVFGIENKIQQIAVKVAAASGFKAVNPGPIDVLENILFYAKNKKAVNFRKNYVVTGYHKNYNQYLDNSSSDVKKWKLIPLKEKVIEANGYKDEKELKKELGGKYESALQAMIEEYAFSNSENVVSVRDLHKPTQQVKELQDKSRVDRDKFFIYDKKDGEKTYIINGGALAFYSTKIREIDGKLQVTELLTNFWSHISWAGIAKEGGVKLKNGKKPEKLLKQIFELNTDEGDLVIDYHLGSGTTAAVAHKMKRRYIGIEQLDYGENDSVARLKNVIAGDETGVSKAVAWKGGGSFVYAELKRYNQQYIDEIEKAKDSKQLKKVYEQMKSEAFFRIEIDHSKWNNGAFEKLELKEQKELLCECLDKNHLYVNLTEMEDAYFKMSKDDIALNKKFYNIS